MIARRIVLSATFILIALACHTSSAQLAVYGTVDLSDYGLSNYQGHDTSFKSDTASLIGGAFYNFSSSSRLKAGIDLRGIYGPGSNGGAAGLAALRVSFVPAYNRLIPYVEFGGGFVSVPYPQVTAVGPVNGGFILVTQSERATNAAATLDFGLDLRLTHRIDYRVVDYGAAASGGTSSGGLGWLGTGIVFHL